MRLAKLLSFFIVMYASTLYPLTFQSVELGKKIDDLSPNKIKISFGEDASNRYKNLENLKVQLKELEENSQEQDAAIQKKRAEIKTQTEALKKEKSNVASKKTMYLTKLEQVLGDIKETKKQLIDTVKQHIEFWEKYFSTGKKQIERIEDKSLYAFSDLQSITKKIAIEEEQRSRLSSKKDEEDGLAHRQENQVSSKDRDIKSIEKEIEELKKQADEKNIKDEVDVFDLEKEVLTKEKQLAELRAQLHEKESEIYDSRILVIQDRLKVLREDMSKIRNQIHIDPSEVKLYEQKNSETKKAVAAKKAKLAEEKNKLVAKKNSLQEKLTLLSNRYGISLADIRKVEEWEIELETLSDLYAAYSVSYEQTKLSLVESLLQKLKVEMAIEDAKSEQAQVLYDTVNSLYGITQGKFKDSDYLDKERAAFKELKQTLLSDIKKSKAEVASAHSFIKDQYKIVNNIKKQQEKLKALAPKVSAINQKKYTDSAQMLSSALEKLNEQKDVALSLSELYTKLTDIKEEALENVLFLLQEIDLIGVWHRATSAVTWEGIKSIIPNIQMFIKGVYATIVSYIAAINIYTIAAEISKVQVFDLFLLLIFLFLAFLLYVTLQGLLPSLYRTLMTDEEHSALYGIDRLLAVFVRSFIAMFRSLYLWFLFLVIASWYQLPVAIMLVFYAYSIFFWIYASRVLLAQFLYVNRKSDYMLLHKRFTDRFSFIFSLFSISMIVILFFRRMFMLVMTYQQSEFPDILLRIFHVVVFICIIFAFDKEDFLQLFPAKSRLGQTVAMLIQQYYYIFLMIILGLLVMSDPYLGGYGSLVWYIFWNCLFTALILAVLFLIHRVIRQYTEVFFFEDNEDSGGSLERFENAKTWYGLYVVLLFGLFLLFAMIVCVNIWGYGLTYETLKEGLYYKLIGIDTGKETKFLKVIDFLRIILIVVLGFFTSYLFRKFVLEKIFEIHYVDPGVQNTITTISRYVIIFIASMIALTYADLGHYVLYIVIFGLFGLGYLFKDLFVDVVAYFFILVQRPLKLGDFVKIDGNTMGVVRKISPRAVVLRRKNAVNIVVPNSMVLKSPLYNWNYTRTYIGFNDIHFAVPFGTDIKLVREILLKILDDDPDVLKVPQPIVRLDDFSDKGYDFLVRGFLSSGNTLRQWDITSNLRFEIVAKLGEQGIKISEPSFKIELLKQKRLVEMLENK